jgi:hypothetical protein
MPRYRYPAATRRACSRRPLSRGGESSCDATGACLQLLDVRGEVAHTRTGSRGEGEGAPRCEPPATWLTFPRPRRSCRPSSTSPMPRTRRWGNGMGCGQPPIAPSGSPLCANGRLCGRSRCRRAGPSQRCCGPSAAWNGKRCRLSRMARCLRRSRVDHPSPSPLSLHLPGGGCHADTQAAGRDLETHPVWSKNSNPA